MEKKDDTLMLISFILCVISCCSVGFFLLPLAWCIPMTIDVYKAYKDGRNLSDGYAVCVLLFVNQVAGILMLVSNSQNKN